MSSPNDIFVSYVSADHAVAQGLCEDLATQGYTVWWDRDLIAGDAFAKAIDEQLVTAKSVIVLWSREALKSRWVAGEAETAASLNKLIPVLLDGVEPVQLPSAGLRALQCIRYGDSRGLQAALDAVITRPTSQVGLASALSARLSRSYRRVARAMTPLRVALLVVVIALLIRTVSDLQAWHAIEHSTAAGDYQTFAASRAVLPNSLFPRASF